MQLHRYLLSYCFCNVLRLGICFPGSNSIKLVTNKPSTFLGTQSDCQRVFCRRNEISSCLTMEAAGSTVPEEIEAKPSSILKSIYKFTRPHTVRGTILASITGVARALIETPTSIELKLFPKAFMGMLALLLGNAFIVGINQIYDVDIDKINKPFLPMAAGEMSKKLAWGVVLSSLIAGPLIVKFLFSPIILFLYCFGLLIGALYSIPPIQTKRNPLLAGLTIACVRGFLLNFGVYYAVKEALQLPFKWSRPVIFLARFMTVFAGVIAITKDLPDIEGDKQYNIITFAVKAGVEKIADVACGVLALNYLSAIIEALFAPGFNRRTMVLGHSFMMFYLYRARSKLIPASKESTKSFYARIWDLFYMEYLLYPFI